MLLGVDVSKFQNPDKIDWSRFAAQGVNFAFVRAAYGVTLDTTFQKHVRRAHAAGLKVGAYHFVRHISGLSGKAQADAFLDALQPVADLLHQMLSPALDLEDNAKNGDIPSNTAAGRKGFRTVAAEWLEHVEEELSRTAIIYTGSYFFDDVFGTDSGYGARPLWIAHYTAKPAPRLPAAWKRHALWQFTETGELDGYDGPLDLNRFEGTVEDLKRLGRPSPQQPTAWQSDVDMTGVTRVLGVSGLPLRRINTHNAHLRKAPRIETATEFRKLPLATEVEVLAGEAGEKWAEVRTRLNGQAVSGFVAQSLLREPESDAVERLVAAAIKEWMRFDFGKGKETIAPYRQYIGEMWKAIGLSYDGGDTNQFWSAAAISFMMRGSGPAYAAFKFSQRHSDYIKDAIEQRFMETPAPFWGYKLAERRPKVGDMVAAWRETITTFDSARTKDRFASHCDVIVSVMPDRVKTLGGNVDDSVSMSEFPLTADGFLKGGGKVFALMANTNR